MSQAPWLKFYGDIPAQLDYPDCSMAQMVMETAERYPKNTAYTFMGRKTSYEKLAADIRVCAGAFRAIGVQAQDRVTICMPNTPQAVTCFYALNLIGAVSSMIHPLSSEGEIAFYLENAKSEFAVTLDQFYPKFTDVLPKLKKIIIARIKDELSPVKKLGYRLTEGRKTPLVQAKTPVLLWPDFMAAGKHFGESAAFPAKGTDLAVILYSGGTTGLTKGVLLSNLNFNAMAKMTAVMAGNLKQGQSMLAMMPIFHGFGFGVCVHTSLINGCVSILVPRFKLKSFAKLLEQERPNYIAGVPTLFEAMLKTPAFSKTKLDSLLGVFSGGDTLPPELKTEFDGFLKAHGAKIQIREGYGATECVAVSCLTPHDMSRTGSIGIPVPDTFFVIVKPGTTQTVPSGELGEICIKSPTVMLGYLNQPEETEKTLMCHEDGNIWLHTGDLGFMDTDGFVYFKQRIKRIIISSGYSIYPSQLESVIRRHELVRQCCVIGVPDPRKRQKVKAFVVLNSGACDLVAAKESIFTHCQKNIAKYAMPYEIEIRDDLPQTLLGKIAYIVLEEEAKKVSENRRKDYELSK